MNNTRILARKACILLYFINGPPVFSILGAERAEFRRQQAEEAVLPVVAAVAVVVDAAAPAGGEEGAPLRAQEFERDEDFRVMRRFMGARHIGQHAGLLQEASSRPAVTPTPRGTAYITRERAPRTRAARRWAPGTRA